MTPRLPGENKRNKERAQKSGTWVAMIFVIAIVAGLIALTSQIMPQISGLMLVVAGMAFFIAFHYFTWGRWLIAYQEKLKAESDESA